MITLRITAPTAIVDTVVATLRELDVVVELLVVRGAAQRPEGDALWCTLPREAASGVVETVCALGVRDHGTIVMSDTSAVVSPRAAQAAADAAGAGADAVIWEAVDATVERSVELSVSFLMLMQIAGVLATIALLTDSLVLIIGAMVVGPEYGPLAGLCVASVRRRWTSAGRALTVLLLGFGFAVGTSFLAALLFTRLGWASAAWDPSTHPFTSFVARPDAFTGVVAALAGIAGMLSLTTGQHGALVGVFISVTTIPAAGNVGMAAAYGEPGEAWGAAVQLAINVIVIVIAGVLTLLVQRHRYAARLNAVLEKVPRVLLPKRRGPARPPTARPPGPS